MTAARLAQMDPDVEVLGGSWAQVERSARASLCGLDTVLGPSAIHVFVQALTQQILFHPSSSSSPRSALAGVLGKGPFNGVSPSTLRRD